MERPAVAPSEAAVRAVGAIRVGTQTGSPTTEDDHATRTSHAQQRFIADGASQRPPEPRLAPLGVEIQRFGTTRLLPIALAKDARSESCRLLNEILADSMVLHALYKKHHWLVAGPTFYQLHLLFDKHAEEQIEIIDLLAERVQSLGGIAVGRPAPGRRADHHPAAARRRRGGRGDDPSDARRARDDHREGPRGDRGDREEPDWGSNDILMSDVLRRHELQVWFVAQHVVKTVPAESRWRGTKRARWRHRRSPPVPSRHADRISASFVAGHCAFLPSRSMTGRSPGGSRSPRCPTVGKTCSAGTRPSAPYR